MTFTPEIELVSYHLDAPLFSAHPLGWLMHVQQGNGDPFGYYNRLLPPNRVFGHFWVAKTGTVKEHQTLDRQAWHAMAGNAIYYGVEFEGFVNEPLNSQQIFSGALIHNLLQTPDVVMNTPGYLGVGTHGMGGNAYGHPSCPGNLRASQRIAIINQAARLRGGPTPPTHPAFTTSVRQGNRGPVVVAVQRRLIRYGYPLIPDGIFGPLTNTAVRRFQTRFGLSVDGIVGPLTWNKLWG